MLRRPVLVASTNGFQGQSVFIIPSQNLVVVRLGASSGPTGTARLVAQIIEAME